MLCILYICSFMFCQPKSMAKLSNNQASYLFQFLQTKQFQYVALIKSDQIFVTKSNALFVYIKLSLMMHMFMSSSWSMTEWWATIYHLSPWGWKSLSICLHEWGICRWSKQKTLKTAHFLSYRMNNFEAMVLVTVGTVVGGFYVCQSSPRLTSVCTVRRRAMPTKSSISTWKSSMILMLQCWESGLWAKIVWETKSFITMWRNSKTLCGYRDISKTKLVVKTETINITWYQHTP